MYAVQMFGRELVVASSYLRLATLEFKAAQVGGLSRAQGVREELRHRTGE